MGAASGGSNTQGGHESGLLASRRKPLASRSTGRHPDLSVFEKPDIHIVDFSGSGTDYRAEEQRQAAEGRRRYLARVEMTLRDLGLDPERAGPWGEALLDSLFEVTPVDGDEPCRCACHPRLPESDFHDYGFGCPCQKTAEERRRAWEEWRAERDAYWESPEGREVRVRRQAEEDELLSWLAGQPDVVVTSYGGLAPEQWSGSVEGRKFYFRERHDHWRIELDLRPSGDFSKIWKGGDLDDEDSLEMKEIETGDVIAEGVTGAPGYGSTPLERAQFIVGTIREHIGRDRCQVHSIGRAALEDRTGVMVRWCPACGVDLGRRRS